MPSLLPPEPMVSCFDNLDLLKDFENEFPAIVYKDAKDFENEFPSIVYNDASTSKSGLLTEPILSPQHIDGFDLNDETLLSEYDEEEQNILYFNDLFPFNIIHTNQLKLDKDNDDDKININQSSGEKMNTQGSNKLLETRVNAANEEVSTTELVSTAYVICIRYFDIDQEFAHMVAASKVSMLKSGEFQLWRIGIEQYIHMIDYALWEVIKNGATLPKTTIMEGKEQVTPITSAEDKARRRLEVKARSTLMMGIPNEH
ncbi:hypothetical protein Tco_1290726, partial [Tanacetum coccineum]